MYLPVPFLTPIAVAGIDPRLGCVRKTCRVPKGRGALAARKGRQIAACSLLATVFALMGAPSGALASELTLTTALTEAALNHPSVKARQSELRAAESERRGTQWSRYPSLGVELQTASGGNPNSVARISQPIWTGGRLTSQLAAAEANLLVAKASVTEAQQIIMLEAATAFFEIQRLRARLAAAVANEAEHRRLLDTIERRVKAEVSPVTDATQAQARFQQAITERLQFERQLETVRFGLEQVVGKPAAAVRAPRDIMLDQWTSESLVEAAQRYSPERQRREAQVEAAEAQIQTAKAVLMPQLSLQQEVRLGSLQPGVDRGRLFLALNVQTGAGLSSLSAIDVAIARQQAARDGLEQNKRQLEQSILSTWNDVNALAVQLKPSRDLLEASDDVVASYLRQFQVGRKMWIDVLNAQREKTNARYALADIEAPLLLAKLRLLLLVGAVRPDSLTAIYD